MDRMIGSINKIEVEVLKVEVEIFTCFQFLENFDIKPAHFASIFHAP